MKFTNSDDIKKTETKRKTDGGGGRGSWFLMNKKMLIRTRRPVSDQQQQEEDDESGTMSSSSCPPLDESENEVILLMKSSSQQLLVSGSNEGEEKQNQSSSGLNLTLMNEKVKLVGSHRTSTSSSESKGSLWTTFNLSLFPTMSNRTSIFLLSSSLTFLIITSLITGGTALHSPGGLESRSMDKGKDSLADGVKVMVPKRRTRSLNPHGPPPHPSFSYSSPPTVRPPPYLESDELCPEVSDIENWIDTLCGDLNKGYIPTNPLGHQFLDGTAYPFEIIKNKTLEFFRHALPVLKNDKSLPKVARYNPYTLQPYANLPGTSGKFRSKRSAPILDPELQFIQDNFTRAQEKVGHGSGEDYGYEGQQSPLDLDEGRYPSGVPVGVEVIGTSRRMRQHQHQHPNSLQSTRFCENGNPSTALLCKLYYAMWGKSPHSYPTRPESHESHPHIHHPNRLRHPAPHHQGSPYLLRHVPPKGRHHPGFPLHHGHHHHQQQHPSTMILQQQPVSAESKTGMMLEGLHLKGAGAGQSAQQLPPTPCPSSAEYLTPVFARNHEGAWRYVVQIPREGYFTQTVEVTKCTETKCYYMDGSCRTSPRWQSLLVAELFYPDSAFPTSASLFPANNIEVGGPGSDLGLSTREVSPFGDVNGNEVLMTERVGGGGGGGGGGSKGQRSRAQGQGSNKIPPQCDGVDQIGCFQVRLFYDWFLIPGSCKCWRRQFDFTRVHGQQPNGS